MKKLMMVGMVAAVVAGCVSVNKNDGGNSAIAPNVIKDTIHEKYSVGKETVTATDQINCLFGFISWGSTATHMADLSDSGFGGVGKAMNGAYANACDAAKCDSLVGTRYTLTATEYTWKFHIYDVIKAEVKGYPVSVSGAEVIPADKEHFNLGGVEKTGSSKNFWKFGKLPF